MSYYRKKMLIYAGAFNPPHKGHLKIVENAIKAISPDEIVVIIDKNPPWKNCFDLVPYSYRLTMMKNLFANHFKYKVYENKETFKFAVDIVLDIKYQYPNYDLYFLMGQDQYDLFHTWKDYKIIEENLTIVMHPRSNDKAFEKNELKHIILNSEHLPCSSSEIKTNLDVKYLGKKNFDFIKKNHLYLQYQIKNWMTKSRYEHSMRVYETACFIAIKLGFNDKEINQLQIASLLHDVAKKMSDQEIKQCVSEEKIKTLPNIHCAHGIASATIAKNIFKVNDKIILEAIENHVIFNAYKNKIAKVLYCADKLEPSRTEQDIANREGLLKLVCTDLDKGFEMVQKSNLERY